MSLLTESIDIDAIASSVPRSQFSEEFIEQLAASILRSKGIINPLILRQKTPLSYEVVEGHLEYYAAVKANQLDSDFESIRAFVVKPQNEHIIREQVKLLRTSNPTKKEVQTASPKNSASNPFTDLQQLAKQVQRIEQKLDTNALMAIDSQKLEDRIQKIGQKLNADLSVLNQRIDSLSISLASLIAGNATKIVSNAAKSKAPDSSTSQKAKSPVKHKTSSQKLDKLKEPSFKENPKEVTILNHINTLTVRQLALKLSRAGLKETIRDNLISARNEGQFSSLKDLLKRVNGLGEKTLQKIIDRWA